MIIKINASNYGFRQPNFLSSRGRVSGRHNRVKSKIDVLFGQQNRTGNSREEVSAFRLYTSYTLMKLRPYFANTLIESLSKTEQWHLSELLSLTPNNIVSRR